MDNTAEKINFSCKSIENLIRILVTIWFEKTKSMRDITIYHERFDKEPDDVFKNFLEKTFPDGCVIGEAEIAKITDYIYDFMQRDGKTKDLYIKYDKQDMYSWVYFKPEKDLRYAPLGDHALIVRNICLDFFHGFDNIDVNYLQRFIAENFEIQSDYTTIEMISKDAPAIAEAIIFNNMYRTT